MSLGSKKKEPRYACLSEMNVQFTAAPYLEMFFGAKQNPWYKLEM